IYNFSSSGDEGTQFEGDVIFNKDIIAHSEDYWDLGLSLLSSRTDRFLKIENYSANLVESADEEYIIEIEFSGIAYDKDKLVLLEDNLKEVEHFTVDASVSYNIDKEQESDFIEFKGSMRISL
ncbi:MAG: hypothetical protein KAS78_06445, partial [Candidatus Pacebacteria bacterium]|nr:hypothetical protein [Candidatus Paceibacterota bacterium]